MVSIPEDLSLKRAPSVVVIENNPLQRRVQALRLSHERAWDSTTAHFAPSDFARRMR